MVKEAEKLMRQEEKKKKREALIAAKDAGEDVESLASSNIVSDKSKSKKSRMNEQD